MPPIRPGDVVTVEVTYAAPHHLVADGPVLAHRRTRAGDAWEARRGRAPAPAGVSLGMPSVGLPVDDAERDVAGDAMLAPCQSSSGSGSSAG